MSLPPVIQPKFQTSHPSDGKPYTFRPFVVKEQRSMLIAAESGDPRDIMTSLVDLVDACTGQSFMRRPLVDLEWAFMNIRARSVGEIIELSVKCNSTVHTEHSSRPCGHTNHIDVDIRTAKFDPAPESLIQVGMGVNVKLTGISPYNIISGHSDEELVVHNTQYVTHGDVLYTEFSNAELVEFYNNIGATAWNSIEAFFASQPTLVLDVPHKCEKCGADGNVRIEGVLNFFG